MTDPLLPQGERGCGATEPSPLAGEGGARREATGGRGVARERARSLRRNQTDAEAALWRLLRAHRLAGYKFRRQLPVGRYVVDFACPSARLIVEADGGQHAESRYDADRDDWLAANGWLVLRIWNNDILNNEEGVLTAILAALEARTPASSRAPRTPLPSPLPQGERELSGGTFG